VLFGFEVVPTNAMTVTYAKLEDADIPCFGAPCTPFSRNGNGGGLDDAERKLFLKGIRDCAELAKRKSLCGVRMENTAAIMESREGRPAPIERLR
jgi:site-specific DNA-cytosine methylase